MSQEIEIEFKNLLTSQEYRKLDPLFHSVTPIVQINHYFETPDFALKRHGGALRIRVKQNQYQLTLKQPNPSGSGLLETHQWLSEKEAGLWLSGKMTHVNEITPLLEKLSVHWKELRYGGKLQTTRKETNYQETILVLDHSVYNGKEDFELELEATDEQYGNQVFTELLDAFQIEKRETPSKIERFYHTLE
ncbi:CYTH domain-containing protein [Gracilibacillus dipsosauri]|uniref:Adenylate cyclase n=1 Tax=Gracilibacillus dipsosauri TaxID=178340 RepID=A0A317KWL4_9BACI|nr:CYTH domain-containing protein [Gracilibacillus dipsosauri]PWU67706.1 adenylate cyclase [Gracilibacillus dipsosauri]